MDIETAVLTGESQDKLAKPNSRGLTCTLVTKAINSDKSLEVIKDLLCLKFCNANTNKSWEVIKDLLCLKFCNANIHTYTLCFMDIQQWEQESIAAYVHRFRAGAKR